MSQLLSMFALLGALALGILLGRIPGVRRFQETRFFRAIRAWTLAVLIFTMGFRIGRTDEVIRGIGTLGLTALAFAAATIAGTLAVLSLIFSLRHRSGGEEGRRALAKNGDIAWLRMLRDPLGLLAVLATGFLAGYLVPLVREANGAELLTWILYTLLVVIGIGLSGSGIRIGEIVTHPDLFLLPLGTIAGSLLGGLAVGLALGMPPGTALALGSGFGWYSLSGVILTRLAGPGIGAVAFLSNMLRESISLVLIPLLARTRFPYLAIGTGGATSMDVTLPLIERSCGPRSVAFAMASGGALSLSVPVLVPLLYHIGY